MIRIQSEVMKPGGQKSGIQIVPMKSTIKKARSKRKAKKINLKQKKKTVRLTRKKAPKTITIPMRVILKQLGNISIDKPKRRTFKKKSKTKTSRAKKV